MLSVARSFVSLRPPALPLPGADPARPRSYGRRRAWVQVLARAFALAAALSGPALPAAAAEGPLRIVALGDSLTAGFGLPASAAFPARLEKALAAKGLAVEIGNAGVSGDTTSAGPCRPHWSVPPG